MRAGKLRHRVEIQERTTTQDPTTGAAVQTWSTLGTFWASVEPLSARDYIAASATQNKVEARVLMRYRDGIDDRMRLLHDGIIYNIEGVLPDPKTGNRWMTLPISSDAGEGR